MSLCCSRVDKATSIARANAAHKAEVDAHTARGGRREAQKVANVLKRGGGLARRRVALNPLARHPLRFSDLGGRDLGGHFFAVTDRHAAHFGIFVRGSQVKPHVGCA